MAASVSRLLLTATFALTLAACGSPTDPTSPTPTPDTPTSAPSTDTPDDVDPGSGTSPALPPIRDAHDDAVSLRTRPFEQARLDTTSGQLHVIWQTGVEPCTLLAGIDVSETDDTVTVTITEGDNPDPTIGACIDLAETVAAPVPLDRPLDGRDVIDGTTSEPVPVTRVGADTPEPAPGPTGTDMPAPSLPTTPGSGTSPALPDVREPVDGAVDVHDRTFDRARYDTTDGSLHVLWSTGVQPCTVLATIAADVDDGGGHPTVTVTVSEGVAPDATQARCVAMAVRAAAAVPARLDPYLDNVTVVDATTGQPVPVDMVGSGPAS